jgi:hypothetical protein
MLSRALSLATVTLLIGCLTAGVVWAENLDAGKSPSQIFSNTCSACHKSPRGLLKSVSASSLPGFLRQHYTTGTDMASVLSSYLISNGAADPKYQGKDQKQKDAKKDSKQDGKPDQLDRPGRRQPPAAPAQEASRPNADGPGPQGEGVRPGRDAKRFARPHAMPDAAKPADGQAPVQAATDSKSGVKQKQGRRGKRPAAEEPSKTEQAVPDDASKEDASRDAAKAETAATDSAKTDPAKTDAIKSETIKGEVDKPAGEAATSAGESGRSETAKVDALRENAGSEPNPLRPDPVPPVTPAPSASSPEPAPGASAAPPPPVTATAPAPPVAPAGAPMPPISR